MEYRVRDATKVIVLVSADGGDTWYPRTGDPLSARPLDNAVKILRLVSHDAGATWETT